MIDDLRGLAVFNAVVAAGSFSGAARRLKLSTSVVSHHVSKLEERLGAPLLFRSTRSMSLTPEGLLIRDAAANMVKAGQEALDALSEQSDQPVGALRIALPAFGAQSGLYRAIWAFAEAHPMVSVHLNSSDKPVDLIADGYDMAIRFGALQDSALKSRKIGIFKRALVASPAYLATRAPVRTLEDLASCDFIGFSMLRSEIYLERDGETVSVHPKNVRLDVDSVAIGRSAVLAGLGVLHLPLVEVAADIASGTLVEVCPEWRLPIMGIYALWPDSGPQKNLTRRLIDFLAESGAE